MQLEALILTRDREVFSLLVPMLQNSGLMVAGAFDPGEALKKLQRGKFDAVVIDCASVPDSADVLEALREGKSNRRAIAFAITEDPHDTQTAFKAGANFAIEKPLTQERVSRALQAAYGLIARERRRYMRLPVDSPLTVEPPDATPMRWNVINVSEGGLGAIAPEANGKVPQGPVRIKFLIPQAAAEIEGKATVVWARTGRVGMQFTLLRPQARVELDRWIAKRFDEFEGGAHGRAR